MEQLNFGYDDNLGLPSDFAQDVSCKTVSYHDLAIMLNDFNAHKLDAMFIPAGTLPYLNDYQIISQSIFRYNNKDTLQSDFVSIKHLNPTDIINATLGRVNEYCTTSYWAPMIYLKNILPANTKLNFKNANSFQDLLFKTAEGVFDAGMVWDIIIQQNADAAKKVHMSFNLSDLPTPIIVAHSGLPQAFTNKLNQFITASTDSFFVGFRQPNLTSLKNFQAAMQSAIEFYKIKLS